MSTVQKVLVTFLFSVFLFAVIVFFTFDESLINDPEGILVLTSVFLTLFLVIFFCFNFRQDSVPETQPMDPPSEDLRSVQGTQSAAGNIQAGDAMPETREDATEVEYLDDEPEELPAAEPEQKTASVYPAKFQNVQIAFGEDDIPYLVESTGLELVDGDLNEIARFIENENLEELEELEAVAEMPPHEIEVVSPFESMLPFLEDEAAELEEISTRSSGTFSIFRRPGVHAFTFSSGNPELLQKVEDIPAERPRSGSILRKAESIRQKTKTVIYEQNGIHYINSNLDSDTDGELDDNFARLVDSVVNVNE